MFRECQKHGPNSVSRHFEDKCVLRFVGQDFLSYILGTACEDLVND